ncbi:MAG TPA: hypothetical protein VFU49_03260 [Ktedonobacteraceae bacterium]|nr:hypothetical protein [Ktedonobacteraceae bacterium]
MMHRVTTLGLDERLERVLAYALGWISGLILFFIEKNRNVRWHAAQSMITFGTLSLVLFGVSTLKGMLSWIPILSLLTNFGLGLLFDVLWWLTIFLWIWLMAMAWLRPNYRLPFVGQWVSYFV